MTGVRKVRGTGPVPAGPPTRATDRAATRAADRQRHDRHRDDAGGVWIRTGIVLGVLFFGFMVVLWAAGFDAIAPFVVIPIVLVALIGANSLLGGPRKREPLAPRPIGPTDRGVDPSTAAGPDPDGPTDRPGSDAGG